MILKNCFAEVDGVDLTCNVRSVEVTMSKPAVESNTMCGAGDDHGIERSQFVINWKQDFTVGKVNATILPHWKNETEFVVKVRANKNAPVSAENPNWTGTCKVFDYTPLSGAVGDLAEANTTFPVQGELTDVTA